MNLVENVQNIELFTNIKDGRDIHFSYGMKFTEFINHLPSSPQIYLINLRRRLDRRDRMLFSLNELEIDVKVVDAVDGK